MKRFVFLLVLSIAFVAGQGCVEPTNNHAGENVTIIETGMGQEFTIELPSNPTTGYSWQLISLTTGSVQLQDKTFKLTEEIEGIVGAGGYEIWTFLAIKKDTVNLMFEYKRSWENQEPPVEKRKFRIVIN